jgi:hypothetical protein
VPRNHPFARDVAVADKLKVCTIGYAVIAVALVLFVQATNVYPQLLLGRLLFSVGGSAVSTMVTAERLSHRS